MKKTYLLLFLGFMMFCGYIEAYASSLDTVSTSTSPQPTASVQDVPDALPPKEEISDHGKIVDTNVTLLPEDADLRFAEGVIIEPSSPPFNLGGWRNHYIVMFPLTVKSAATYSMNLTYSKNSGDGSTSPLAILVLTEAAKQDLENMPYAVTNLPFTGAGWAHYTEAALGNIHLPEGNIYLVLADMQNTKKMQYVMNLRSLELTMTPESIIADKKKSILAKIEQIKKALIP